MNWTKLTDISQLDAIDKESQTTPVLILKHSNRCHICHHVLKRMESEWKQENSARLKPYFLDLLKHRDISDAIADRYDIPHESPQALIIVKSRCVMAQSHSMIELSDLMTA